MKLSHTKPLKIGSFLLTFFSPVLAFAQTINTAQNLFTYIMGILNNYIIPLIFVVAFVIFLYNVYRFFIQGGAEEEKVKEGQRFVIWSMIGFVVMFSVWGLINLLVNTLGFDNTDRPSLPTFNLTPGASVGTGSTLFPSSTAIPSGLTTAGQTITSNGVTYSAVGTPVNGVCTTGTLSNGVCVTATTAQSNNLITSLFGGGTQNKGGTPAGAGTNGAGSGSGSVQPGGACKSDNDCADAGGQSYGCYPEGNGTCTLNGDAPPPANTADGTVQPGGSCTTDTNCADAGGQSYGCYPEGNGTCTLNGDAQAAGTAANGQSCVGNENACSTGICNTDTGLCQAIPADGSVGQGGSCLGNENACSLDTDTCDDNNVCSQDSSVDNTVTTMSCNDGTTQDSDVGCANDCGQAGTDNTCNASNAVGCTDGSTVPAGSSCVVCSDGVTTTADPSFCPDAQDNGDT